jgi:hypothetical protein
MFALESGVPVDSVIRGLQGYDILPVGIVLGDPSLSGYPKNFRAL